MADARRLNWSTLKLLATSPKLLAWRLEHPREETTALRLGRAIHCAILEPEAFPSRWITAGQCAATTKTGGQCGSTGSLFSAGAWYCRVRGHAPEGAGPPPAGVEVIMPEELEIAKLCAASVMAHRVAAGLISGGKSEEAMEWTEPTTGIECRGRVDYLKPNVLVDLKSTRRETLREFAQDCARNLYHCQLAWYHFGGIAAGRLPADAELPYIVSVSTVEPYDVAAFRLSKVTLEAGRIYYMDLLAQYMRCTAANWWPGIAPDLETLDLPNWTPGMNGSDENGDW